VGRGHRHRAGHHDRERPQQRAGGPGDRVRAGQPEKISFLSFQPVSFTGRDEEVTPERRAGPAHTLAHLAHDVKNQTGIGEPARDWFPISFISTFTDWADLVKGPEQQFGNVSCGCTRTAASAPPSWSDKETKERAASPRS